ncbi:MAG: hypothetical protein KDC82_00065 [Bacteroidetes bacterium]|nr:hypothetical protein [Bacteroidota bacterium]
MSIDPADLAKIDKQIQVQKGALPMAFERDDGDQAPPNIDESIKGMGSDNPQAENNGVNVAIALKGFWKFIDMAISMICSRVDAIDYTHLSEAELTNISQQTAQVEVFQKLAVAENAPMWLSVANLIGTFGTKFSLNEDWKKEQDFKKQLKKKQEMQAQLTPNQVELLKKIRNDKAVPVEPIYDAPPKDNSVGIQVIDEPMTDEEKFDKAEQSLKDQLFAAGEVDDATLQRMKVLKRAAAIKRQHEEAKAKSRNGQNGVSILE